MSIQELSRILQIILSFRNNTMNKSWFICSLI